MIWTRGCSPRKALRGNGGDPAPCPQRGTTGNTTAVSMGGNLPDTPQLPGGSQFSHSHPLTYRSGELMLEPRRRYGKAGIASGISP